MVRIFCGLVFLGFAASPAYAHRLVVRVEVTERAIDVAATYEEGDPVSGAKVSLLDRHGAEVAEATSDQAGDARLPRPEPGVYSVTVDDHQGHFEKVVIVVREGESSSAESARRNRYVMAAVGLVAIGVGTALWMRRNRKSPVSPSP